MVKKKTSVRRTPAGDVLPAVAGRVCPFADGVPDESALARDVFAPDAPWDPHIGHHLATYAGWVIESDFRSRGSSGGLVSWLLAEMLERKFS